MTAAIDEDRRLVILKFLNEDVDRAINYRLMAKLLDQVGHGVSRDRVRADLGWLKEAGLVYLQSTSVGDILVAVLNERGQDVAEGRAEHPGVARPSARR